MIVPYGFAAYSINMKCGVCSSCGVKTVALPIGAPITFGCIKCFTLVFVWEKCEAPETFDILVFKSKFGKISIA